MQHTSEETSCSSSQSSLSSSAVSKENHKGLITLGNGLNGIGFSAILLSFLRNPDVSHYYYQNIIEYFIKIKQTKLFDYCTTFQSFVPAFHCDVMFCVEKHKDYACH